MHPIFKLTDVKRYDNLELLARQVVEGYIVGLHKSPMHGFSVEFAEHRIYNSGEDIRNIDWKVFARTDRLYVKRFEEETNLRCQIVIDCSSSMYFPDKDHNKLHFALYASAALMHILKKQRDAFGLTLFSDSLENHTSAKSSVTHFQHILGILEQLIKKAPENKKTLASPSLHLIAERLHKRSLVIIFSDMFDSAEDTEEMFAALQHLKHNKHDVIVFHVVDKAKELDFEFENRPYQFIDMETGEKVKLKSNQVKDYYASKLHAYKQELKLRCGAYKIDFVEVDINEGFEQILAPYLSKRSKMY